MMNDKELIAQVINELTSGFEEFEFRFWSKIFRHINNKIYCREDAEELTEDVLCWLFVHLDEFKNESSLWSYISGVTDNFMKMFVRHKLGKRQLQMVRITEGNINFINNQSSDDDNPVVLLFRKQLRAAIWVVFDELKGNQKIVFDHSHYGGMGNKEIEELLNMSAAVVKALKHKVMVKMEAGLQEFKKDYQA